MLISCALFCHAPVVIPEVAGKHADEVSQTSDAMLRAAEWVVASKPDRIVILSPHATRLSESFSVSSGSMIEGSFSEFGHPEIHLCFPNAGLLGGALCMPEPDASIRVLPAPQTQLDHGSAVPLYFLEQAGWRGQVLVVGFPVNPTPAECHSLGCWLAEVTRGVGGRTALCASGDMSHSLSLDAPNGFHPKAKAFDDFVVDKISSGDLKGALEISESLRHSVGEDIIDSLQIAAAAVDFSAHNHQLFSYEGPFGVGYLVAGLYADAA